MKAIDFICRYLARAEMDTLSPTARQVLLAVAAGLDNSPDIARLTGLQQGVCTSHLRMLHQHRELRCTDRKAGYYQLSPAGKERVRALLSFLDHA